MESGGFGYTDGANLADYLSGVTVPTERKILPGFEGSFPETHDSLLALYQKSPICQIMMTEYDYPTTPLAEERTAIFKESMHLKRILRCQRIVP